MQINDGHSLNKILCGSTYDNHIGLHVQHFVASKYNILYIGFHLMESTAEDFLSLEYYHKTSRYLYVQLNYEFEKQFLILQVPSYASLCSDRKYSSAFSNICKLYMSLAMRKCVLCYMRITKAQISLRIRAV